MTCSLPGRGRALLLILTCALLADGPAQTSHWIAPGGTAEAQWTDPAHWDSGVPNQPGAIAVLPAGTTGDVAAHITNTTVEVGELVLGGIAQNTGQTTSVRLGSPTAPGTLIVSGAGFHAISGSAVQGTGLVLQNGTLLFRNSAVASGALRMAGSSSTVQFTDTAVFSGELDHGFGGAHISFSGHSSVNGGVFTMGTPVSSTIEFGDDMRVLQGRIVSNWGVYILRVRERADLSGLALQTGHIATASGSISLDISGAAGPVRLGSINGYATVVLGANDLVFGSLPAGTFQMNGPISGSGGLRFENTNVGTVWITSPYNTHTGSTYVGSVVNLALGSRLNEVRIADGGRLIAEGSFISRSLSVENGILELNVTPRFLLIVEGSYTQSAAGVLALPVSVSRGLLVNGTATLGGQLDVLSLPAVDAGTRRFPILAADSISGTFASLTGAAPQTAMLQSRLEYAADRVDLLVGQQLFAQVPGATPAAAALGRQIDLTLDAASGGYRDWIAGLNRLATAAEVGTALAGAAPDRLSALPEQAFAQAAARGGIFRDQLRADEGAFVAGLHGRRLWDSSRGLPRVRSTHDGGLAGVVLPAGQVRLGVFGARERSAIDLDAAGSTANDTGTTAGLGFHFTRREYFLTGAFAATGHRYRWHRIVAQAPVVTATHATRARQQDWEIGAGRVFPFARWQAVAEAGVLGSIWRARHSLEGGAGPLAYEFDRWENRSLRSHLGFTLARTTPGARWRPYAGVHWWHEFEPDRALRGRMPAPGGDYYTAPGRHAEIDEVQLQLGMNWRLTRAWTISAEASVSGGHTLRRAENYFGSVHRQF